MYENKRENYLCKHNNIKYKGLSIEGYVEITKVRECKIADNLEFWKGKDVLYDPKTKEVFTPNTGKIQNMSGQELPQAQENDIIQQRANSYHDPKTGKFTNGKTKGNVKFSNSKVLAEGANDFKVKGFKNKQKLNNHWEKHKKEYLHDGIKTKEDYLNKALNLVQSPCGNGIEGYKNNLGQICRYETKTNYYVKGDPEKGIFTMFKPNEGKEYFSYMKEYETGDKKWKKK